MTRILLAAALALLTLVAPAAAQVIPATDAQVRDIEFPVEDKTFEVREADGTLTPTAFRVVENTGNCCETYVATDGKGRLFDFGGNYVNYSDDRGLTWSEVKPVQNFIGGEGAIVVAPGGDVLGVGWDPYTGDTLLAFRYQAATAKWQTAIMPLHAPFYDREWISVVPGPIEINGDTFPWVSFVKGGYPSKEEWLYSTDGLTYTSVTQKNLGATLGGTADGPLTIAPNPEFDVIQANGGMGLTPLGGGRALAEPDSLFAGDYALLSPDVSWQSFDLPGGTAGQFHTDSRGRLHNVIADSVPNGDGQTGSSIEYRISEDGGATFRSTKWSLAGASEIEEIDFRVSGALGLAAISVHHSQQDGPDRDVVYKMDVRGPQPALLRTYSIGLNDLTIGSGVASTNGRFDFSSLALFPDGRFAVSFVDSATNGQPAIAVETGEPLPAGFSASATPAPGPLAGPVAPTGANGGATDTAGPGGRPHRVTLKLRRRGARIIATGEVLPRHPGHVVRIQKRAGKRWKTVARVKLTKRSTFAKSLRLRGKVTLRAVSGADAAGHKSGRSRPVATRR